MNKTALITGASSGFGAEFAKLFAQDGCNLVLVARSKDALENLANELEKKYSIHVTVLPEDLSVTANVEKVYAKLKTKKIEVDFLVNNAGFGDYGFFFEEEYGKLEQMINLNIQALTKLCHLFAPSMIKKGHGRILNVASTAAFQPGPLMAVYYASKAYVLSFSEALGNELEGTGVTVTTLCPGASATGFEKSANLEKSKLFKRKLQTAEEVARFGYKHLMRGDATVIPGFSNRFAAWMIRFVPRKMAVKIVRNIQGKQK